MSTKSTDLFEDFPYSTYYWGHPAVISETKFAAFRSLCKMILKASDSTLADGLGRQGSSPTLDDDLVSFNGEFPDCRETFFFPRVSEDLEFLTPDHSGNFYRFCETGGNGYDLAVGACLHAAVYCKIIPSFGREEGDIPENLLWESILTHITLGGNDAN